MPRTFRGEESRGPEPGAIEEYRPKTMIEEYRGLAVVFGILGLALAVFFIKSVLSAPKPTPPPPQSVYIEVLPQKDPQPPTR